VLSRWARVRLSRRNDSVRLMPSISEPAFGVGSFEMVEEIGLELVQAGEHLGVDVEHWAADAGVLMVAGVP
jgi:hypothetical protein